MAYSPPPPYDPTNIPVPEPIFLAEFQLSSTGILWEVLDQNIQTFLGPESYAHPVQHCSNSSTDYFLYTAVKPFTESQLRDLRAFSAELEEERREHTGPRWPPRRPTNRSSYSPSVRAPPRRRPARAPAPAPQSIVQLQIIVPNPNVLTSTVYQREPRQHNSDDRSSQSSRSTGSRSHHSSSSSRSHSVISDSSSSTYR